MAVIFALFQGSFPLIGALIGEGLKEVLSTIDNWVAFGLLAAVGGKMVYDGFHKGAEGGFQKTVTIGTMCLLGVATSIDALVVGVGLGLQKELLDVVVTSIMIGSVTFVVSLVGVTLGRRKIPVSEKWTTVAAGCVLVALGVKALLG